MQPPSRLAIEDWPLGRLSVDPGNPRSHAPEQIDQIVASVRAFGWTNPLLADPEGMIIAGEARLAAARRLGRATVPVIVLAELSPAARRAYRVADNRIALNAGWDEDLLAAALRDIAAMELDLSAIGFTDAEVAALLAEAEEVVAADFPALPSGDRSPFQQMTFALHDDQAAMVRQALAVARRQGPFEGPNHNGNGNALARVAEGYLASHGPGQGHPGRPG